MIATIRKLYDSWVRLDREGLLENTPDGYVKFKRSEAMGLLVAAAPLLPLGISDVFGLRRGWLWYSWSVVAIAWAALIIGLIIYRTAKVAIPYYRDWWRSRP